MHYDYQTAYICYSHLCNLMIDLELETMQTAQNPDLFIIAEPLAINKILVLVITFRQVNNCVEVMPTVTHQSSTVTY